ncbi:MAG: calcium-binding protein, partial [Acidobacteria bacterium]|nr:calcium-binding protein [Acidobacteriota bacterium]
MKLDKGFASGDGYDTLHSVNVVVGSQFGDLLVGTNHTEKIVDHSYSENLYGSRGNDKLRGRQGPDWLEGSRGDDLLIDKDGVNGNDELNGGRVNTCTS